jgi:hypothetical protein
MMPDEIRIALGKRDAEDDQQMLKRAAKLDRKEGTSAASALAQALAAPTTVALAAPMSVAAGPLSLEPAATASITEPVAPPPIPPW